MRILLITLYYYPDQGGTPGVYRDLCESLSAMGHDVVVVTGLPRYNIAHADRCYRHRVLLTEKINGVEVRRIKIPCLSRHVLLARAMEYLLAASALFLRALFTKRGDVALVHSPVLFQGFVSIALCKLKRMSLVLNVHDIFPQTAIDLGLLRNKWAIKFFQWLEHYVYGRADCISVHSAGNRDWIASHHDNVKHLVVMPIWMNKERLKPGPRDNAWRERRGLGNKFVALFSGSQGHNQDMKVILEVAASLRATQDIRFVIVGDGTQHDEMVQLSRQMKLDNVDWLDWQSDEQYPPVLHTADVVLATLDEKVGTPVVPSKILSAMSAGRPVITCTRLSGDAPKLVDKATAGITLRPKDHRGLAQAILKLRSNRRLAERLGANGRFYVEQHLDVDLWATAHIDLFSHLMKSDGSLAAVLRRISHLFEQQDGQRSGGSSKNV